MYTSERELEHLIIKRQTPNINAIRNISFHNDRYENILTYIVNKFSIFSGDSHDISDFN